MILLELGHHHINEAVLPHGYVVDILLPGFKSEKYPHGVVLEIDGPAHFDTYGHTMLGPGLTKMRHLDLMGYKVVSLPYWVFYCQLSKGNQRKVIKSALDSAVESA